MLGTVETTSADFNQIRALISDQGEHGGHSGQCSPKRYPDGDPLIQLRLHLQFG
jgi:hypothetical protein